MDCSTQIIYINYHSLYTILDYDWLIIHLQVTACKYRSAANNWCKYLIEHAHFENASSASTKKYRSFFQNVNMVRFAELSESELSTILEVKDTENTKKAIYFKHISRLLVRKWIEGSRSIDIKS